MDDPIANGARAAAQRLAPTYGPRLSADVEAALYSQASQDADREPPKHYIDPIAIATLIVDAASLAWTIYRDLRAKHSAAPATDYVVRRVRTTMRETRTLDDGAEQVIETTVEETLRALPPME